jgi:hypothetical protein
MKTKMKILIFYILFIGGLNSGCEDKQEQEILDPNNLFQFSLKDENPNSKSYNSNIGPNLYKGRISVYYFGDPG